MYTYAHAPRMDPVSLPAMSPRPVSTIHNGFSSQPWPTNYQTAAASFPRFDEDQRRRSYSSSSSHAPPTYNPSIQYASGGRAATGSYGGHASSRPPAERTGSMTPAPLKSILKSSRTRRHSVSSNPEASNNVAPVRAERGSSNLSKSTVTVHTTAPLKEEAISLSWPLIRFDQKRSDRPLLYFDAGFDPRLSENLQNKKYRGFSPLSEADRNLPVSTHCTLTKMVIQCPEIGEITVKRSRGVRCVDVFTAIYDAYHVHLRRDELPRNMGRHVEAFEKRREDDRRSTEAERKEGMRRVDLLRGKQIFDGLSRCGKDWKLEFYAYDF